jgi:fatty acid desaturase
MSPPRPFFRHSPLDAIPALCGAAVVALLFGSFLCFDRLSGWVLVPAFLAVAGSSCWNRQCVAHPFIHHPFFNHPWLNRAYSVLQTLAAGVPHVLYHHYHLNHHSGDSDARGPDGTTRDWSSIYRHGQGGHPEPFWRYCLLGFFRVEVRAVLRTCFRHGRAHAWQCAAETAVLGGFWLLLLLANWRYLVFFYLPAYSLGWVLSRAQGYLEHHGARPGNPFANSVSSYNRIYNFFCFNAGYHQEHHWDPGVHWTRLPELHDQLRFQLQVNRTRTLRGPHLTAFLEDWLTARPVEKRSAA